MTSRPCKECPDRHTACHDHCERYAEFKVELDRIRQNEQRERDIVNGLHAIKTEQLERTRRHKNVKTLRYR